MSSDLYSDSEESGSGTEELTDDGSFEDDGEDEEASEGSDKDLDEDFEQSSRSSTATGDSGDNDDKDRKSPDIDDNLEPDLKLSSQTTQNSGKHNDEERKELNAESSPDHDITNKGASSCIQKSATVSNGPARSRHPANWGRAPGKKNLSMESIDFDIDDEFEIERLENSKIDLQNRITEEAKANAFLRENLQKHKNDLHERRLALEQDVERLQEELQKERDLRTALEAGLNMFAGAPVSFSVDEKVKAELEEIALAEVDVINLKQKADDLTLHLNQQRQQNSAFMSDRCNLPEQKSNYQGKHSEKKDSEAASSKRSSEKSARNKGQSNKSDAENDMKPEPLASTNKHVPQNQHLDAVHNSKPAGLSPSSESVTGKPATSSSKRQSNRSEGMTSTSYALSKLTNRLHFLKERRTQIASEMQNFDKGRSSNQPVLNSDGHHSSEKNRGPDQSIQHSDKGVSSEGSSTSAMEWERRSDLAPSPNLERGKSETLLNVEKGQTGPSRTMSR